MGKGNLSFVAYDVLPRQTNIIHPPCAVTSSIAYNDVQY